MTEKRNDVPGRVPHDSQPHDSAADGVPRDGRPGGRESGDGRPGGRESGGRARVIVRRIGLVLLGIILYTISMNMYSGYPSIGSQWINRAAILAIVVFAAVVFIRDERRRAREDEDDPHADVG